MTNEELDQQEAAARANCPACREKRLHTPEEWANHPHAGSSGPQ